MRLGLAATDPRLTAAPPRGLPGWLPDLPAGVAELVRWLLEPWVLISVSLLSIALFVLSLLGLPWLVRRIPKDFLLERIPRPKASGIALAGRVLKNVLGLALLCLGVLMLALPGQGLLTMLVGLALVDFPGKSRLQRKLFLQPRVLRSINDLRRKAGHPELSTPGRDDL